jgi:hypothetical protein
MAEITMEQLRSVPFSQRWGILKPVLQDLYLHQDKKLTEVVQSMRAEYGFMAK